MRVKISKTAFIFFAVLLFSVNIALVRASEIYVASNDVYVIDDGEYRVTQTIPLGKWVYNITISEDGKKAYLGASNGVNVLNLEEKRFEGVLFDKPAFTVKVDDVNNRIFVLTNESRVHEDGVGEADPSKVMILDSRDSGLLRTIQFERLVFDMAIFPEKDRLYCLDILESELEVRQLTSGAHIETIKLGDYGYEDKNTNQGFLWRMVRDKSGEKIYIPQGGIESGLLIVDTASNSVRRISFEHEAKWRAGILSRDGKKLYLNGVRRLSVFDLEKEVEVAWKPLDGPYQEIAIDATGSKLYLTNPMYDTGGSVAVLDAETLEPLGRVVVPDASPFSVAAY